MPQVLLRSDGDNQVQAMPLRKGKVNITSGVHTPNLIYCVVDGTFTITWENGGTSPISMIEGATFALMDVESITITGGTFHLA